MLSDPTLQMGSEEAVSPGLNKVLSAEPETATLEKVDSTPLN